MTVGTIERQPQVQNSRSMHYASRPSVAAAALPTDRRLSDLSSGNAFFKSRASSHHALLRRSMDAPPR